MPAPGQILNCTRHLHAVHRYKIEWTVSGDPTGNDKSLLSSFFYIGESRWYMQQAGAGPTSRFKLLSAGVPRTFPGGSPTVRCSRC